VFTKDEEKPQVMPLLKAELTSFCRLLFELATCS